MPDRLREYRRRRDFGATPEPAGVEPPAPAAESRFVVHEHRARRLHWDLRLERDGALASWALPRFLPDDPGENRLAIRTEDHPLDYLGFQGTIPAGQYGAGEIHIFDRGTYAPLLWEARKVEVELHGERLRGRWALFATGRSPRDERSWMIHRMGAPVDPGAEPLPQWIEPMLARPGSLPEGDGWAFEVKWDGARMQCRSEPGRLTLRSRSGSDVSARYPELAGLGRALREHRAILDGEVVVADGAGRPSFQALQRRMHAERPEHVRRLARETPVTYVVFDLLWLDGRPLLELPYAERRRQLDALALDGERWQVPKAHLGDGRDLLAATERLGLEGVVAKRLDGTYEPGRRSARWVKVKRRPTAELLIGGWLAGRGGRGGRIGSLLLGDAGADGRLRYAGRVGSGLSQDALDDLAARLAPLARRSSPFAAGGARPPREAHWVEPELLAEVAFGERSRGGLLRHPVWVGLRDDAPRPLVLEDEREMRGKGRCATALVDGRRIAVTNLDKPLYPDGFSKRDALDYVARIAPLLAAHLRGRALTLKRFPDGVDGESFFEKRAPSHAPAWVRTETVAYGRERIRHVIADDAPTLVWLAQLAALELHASAALADAPDRPTWLAFDLDPGPPAGIVECCRVALLLRGMLDGVGLRALAKTSGGKGLHLLVPLNRPDATFAQAKRFSRAVAELLAGEEPGLVVARQAKGLRSGRVLVDWYQNDRARTMVAPYSLRARERPTVSAPVTWEEIEACAAARDTDALRFLAPDVLRRMDEHGDLLAPALSLSQRLPAM